MGDAVNVVLAIDPGRMKCGVAVVQKMNAGPKILHRCVADTSHLDSILSELYARFSPDTFIIGNGTTSAQVLKMVESLKLAPAILVDEKSTTLLARKRYFAENPPRGLRRLIPTTLQTPPAPYDDYVAVILAERYLEG